MRSTESFSFYDNLEDQPTIELLKIINNEDKKVPFEIEKSLDDINILIDKVFTRMNEGGRLFYIGSGTPGRLGIVDASECPPTYGVDNNVIIGLIAGGDYAIRNSVENAEDDFDQAWKDLKSHNINSKDSVIGISASGRTPYVIGGLKYSKKNNILTGLITSNAKPEASEYANIVIETILGPRGCNWEY